MAIDDAKCCSLVPPSPSAATATLDLLDPEFRGRMRQYITSLGVSSTGPNTYVLASEALRRGLTVASAPRGALELGMGRRRFRWNRGNTNLNAAPVRRISPQKEVNSRVLRSRGVFAPENAVFGPLESRRAWLWGEPVAPLVVKPYNASKGRGVHLRITDWQEFNTAFEAVARDFGDVLVEQFVEGSEHRVYVVDGKMIAATRRIPANVIGDGVSSITELVEAKNETLPPAHRPIRLGVAEDRLMARSRLDRDAVPRNGERVALRETSNLSTGADAVDATDELCADEVEFVEQSARCWPGLRSAGIDVLFRRDESHFGSAIIEINHAAGIGGHHFPRLGQSRNVAGSILDAMFPETRGVS